MKNGALIVAQKSGAPIVPLAISFESKWQFRSWDAMTLPKPFSRAVLVRGDRIYIKSETSAEQLPELSAQVQAALEAANETAEKFYSK
jgi:lysophospholipid acyltransferase (LPLAT)-like uncharacterized protein